MALIQCPECKKNISDRAASCPDCGCPLAQPVQTIEQTAKKYKGMQLLGVLLACVGVVVLIFGSAANPDDESAGRTGGLIMCAGFGLYVYSRFAAWWHHA